MAVAVSGGDLPAFSAPRRLFRSPIRDSPSDARDSYAVMPDGQSFLIDARREVGPAAITVMSGWAAGLTLPRPTAPARAEIVASRQAPDGPR